MDILPHLRETIELIEATTREKKLETTPLPYEVKDLDPVMSEKTLDYHYEHLAKGYARRYNSGEGDADFNRAGSFLHNKFFPQFRSPKSPNRPKGVALALIESKFGDFDAFKDAVKVEAMKLQGSGWIYLSTSGEIKTIRNHAVRTDIALLLDMWEHAYSLQYQWRKEDYIDDFWRIVNWDIVNERIGPME